MYSNAHVQACEQGKAARTWDNKTLNQSHATGKDKCTHMYLRPYAIDVNGIYHNPILLSLVLFIDSRTGLVTD